jgi:hypothetical protein
MDHTEFQSITSQIAQNLNNQALVTELLTKLSDGFSTIRTGHDNFQQQLQTSQEEIKTLQQTNMNLFLKVSQTPIAAEKTGTTEPLKYEDIIKSIGV